MSTLNLKRYICIWIFSIKQSNNFVLPWMIHLQTNDVKCTSTQTQVVTCQVGYPVLKRNQEVNANRKNHFFTCEMFWVFNHTTLLFGVVKVTNAKRLIVSLQMKFQINFDYSFAQLQNRAEVKFEAKRLARRIRNLITKNKLLKNK